MSVYHDQIVTQLYTSAAKLFLDFKQELVAHADRDNLFGLKRTLFIHRGAHAPGEICSTAPQELSPLHQYWCQYPENECECHYM